MVTELTDKNPFTGFGYVQRRETGVATYANLSNEGMESRPVHEIRKIMARSAPSVSQGLTNFQKYCNAGWTILPDSHPVIDGLMDSMVHTDGGFKGFVNSLLDSLFLHGACFFESVYDENRLLKRMVSQDVDSAVFRLSDGPIGQFYELGQWQSFRSNSQWHTGLGSFRSLHDDPTIEYLTLFSETNDPYGRSFIDSALFHLIMVVDFFKAYKDVLTSIVWPNLLVNVDREVIRQEVSDPNKAGRYCKEGAFRAADSLAEVEARQRDCVRQRSQSWRINVGHEPCKLGRGRGFRQYPTERDYPGTWDQPATECDERQCDRDTRSVRDGRLCETHYTYARPDQCRDNSSVQHCVAEIQQPKNADVHIEPHNLRRGPAEC